MFFPTRQEDLEKLESCLMEDDKKPSNPCDLNPCLNGGSCKSILNGSDYLCVNCSYLTSGKNCEHFKCDKSDDCFHRNGMAYAVFKVPANGRSWVDANHSCANQGMNFTMPKDKVTNDYVINELRSIYGGGSYLYFWAGMKYNENSKQWQWADGSPLDVSIGGNALKGNTGHVCGILYLNGGSTTWWAYPCTNKYYFICEKRISDS